MLRNSKKLNGYCEAKDDHVVFYANSEKKNNKINKKASYPFLLVMLMSLFDQL